MRLQLTGYTYCSSAYISIKSPILEIPGFALVNYTPGHTPKNLDMISTAIAAVLSVLPNLPVFHLSGRITLVSRGFELLPPGQVDRHLAPMSLLEHVLCPNLREVDLDIPRRGNSAPLHFIRRHSKLIVARLCVRQPGLRNSVKLCMPSLERFEAPAGSFQYFADTIPPKLSHVAVDFVYVASVARLAFPKLLERELNVIRSFPSLKLLTLIGDNNLHQIETMGAVAARIPNLEQLEIRHKSYPCLMSKPRVSPSSLLFIVFLAPCPRLCSPMRDHIELYIGKHREHGAGIHPVQGPTSLHLRRPNKHRSDVCEGGY